MSELMSLTTPLASEQGDTTGGAESFKSAFG